MPTDREPNSSDRLKKMQIALYLDADQLDALKVLSSKTRRAHAGVSTRGARFRAKEIRHQKGEAK